MKGFILGVIVTISTSVFAVNYARDIAPLIAAVSELQDRVSILEERL